MEKLDLFVREVLQEKIVRLGRKWVVISHKSNKVIGKKEGYRSKRAAVRALLGMTSRGRFYSYDKSRQRKLIRNYIKKRGL